MFLTCRDCEFKNKCKQKGWMWSQSPQIGSMFLTCEDCYYKDKNEVEEMVAIPSNRVNVSYVAELQDLFVPEYGELVAIPSNRVNVSY